MAGYQILEPTAGSTDWTDTATQREKQRKGFLSMSLSNWDTTGVPAINAGSVVEMGGSLFQFTSTEAIGGTFTTSNPNYIYLTSSSSSLTASATSTAPTWSIAKQAWYDAGGTKRCIGGCASNRDDKWLYIGRMKGIGIESAATGLEVDGIKEQGASTHEMKCKVIDIGNWDMNATAPGDGSLTKAVAHGLTLANIRACSVLLRNDANDSYYDFHYVDAIAGGDVTASAMFSIGATNVDLTAIAEGEFDSVDFNTASSYNRGWITIWYVA